jgi:hypothetical protein
MLVLEVNIGLDKELSLLLGGVIQVMFVIGKWEFHSNTAYQEGLLITLHKALSIPHSTPIDWVEKSR